MLAALAKMEALLAQNSLIGAKLESALLDLSEDISPVVRHSLISVVSYAHQNFGFTIFSEIGMKVLADFLAEKTYISAEWICMWLESTATSLLEEQATLGQEVLDASPTLLNRQFTSEVFKRIYSCEPSEEHAIGLDCFPKDFLVYLRRLASVVLSTVEKNVSHLENTNEFKQIEQSSLGCFAQFFLDDAKSKKVQILGEPLALLFWRLHCFQRNSAPSVVCVNTQSSENKASTLSAASINAKLFAMPQNFWPSQFSGPQMCAALALLLPYIAQSNEMFLPSTPIRSEDICSALIGKKSKRSGFDSQFFFSWISDGNHRNFSKTEDLNYLLQEIYRELCGLGFAFQQKKKVGRKEVSIFALSTLGIKVVLPFHKLIENQLLANKSSQPHNLSDAVRTSDNETISAT